MSKPSPGPSRSNRRRLPTIAACSAGTSARPVPAARAGFPGCASQRIRKPPRPHLARFSLSASAARRRQDPLLPARQSPRHPRGPSPRIAYVPPVAGVHPGRLQSPEPARSARLRERLPDLGGQRPGAILLFAPLHAGRREGHPLQRSGLRVRLAAAAAAHLPERCVPSRFLRPKELADASVRDRGNGIHRHASAPGLGRSRTAGGGPRAAGRGPPCHYISGDPFEIERWKSSPRLRAAARLHLAWPGLPHYSLPTSLKNFQAGLGLFQFCGRSVVRAWFYPAEPCFEYGDLAGGRSASARTQGLFAAFKALAQCAGAFLPARHRP